MPANQGAGGQTITAEHGYYSNDKLLLKVVGFHFSDDEQARMEINEVDPAVPPLPRVGISMRLAQSIDSVAWFGRGPMKITQIDMPVQILDIGACR